MAKKKASFLIEVEDKSCKLTSIDRSTLEVALSFVMPSSGKPEYIRAGELILRNAWVEGDDEILSNDDYLIPAAMQAYQLINIKQATLKKI